MPVVLLIALLVQDPNGAAAAGTITWNQPAPVVAEAPAAPPPPTLPAWALADPFGWERAQCSPLIRKDATLEACQARVRTDLAANLGDALPATLRPPAVQECRRSEDGYAVDCGAPARPDRASPVLREQDCGTRHASVKPPGQCHQPALQQVQHAAFIAQRGGLHVHHVQIPDQARLVLVLGQAQRLARRLCPHCKQPADLDEDALRLAG